MSRSRMFYGWWVVWAFALIVFLSTGVRFTIGPFLKPVVSDLGVDRGSFSLVVALSMFLFGAVMPFIGRVVDRYGPRLVVVSGGILLAGALAATGMATSLWHLTLFYGVLVAVGFAATGHVVATAVLSQWFVVRRGLVVGLLSGASMGGMTILTPLAMWLILLVGWRGTYWVLAAASFVLIVPLGLWVVRDRPERMGLAPDGFRSNPEQIAASAAAVEAAERTTLTEATRSHSFWQLLAGFFGCGFSMNLISAHGVPMLTDHGFHPMTAASALGLLGGVSIGGAMLLGFLSDRYGRRVILAIVYAVRALVFAGLVLAGTTGGLVTVVVVGGIGWSGSMAMTSALTADIFGRYSVGSIFSVIFLSHQVGAALGSWLGGALYDLTGGYGAPFGLASAILLLSATFSLTIQPQPRSVAVQARPVESPL